MGTTQRNDSAGDLMPREKLTGDPKGESLSQEELLAIVIGSGAVGCPVLELSRRLIEAFHSPGEFIRADWLEMKRNELITAFLDAQFVEDEKADE